MNHSQNQDQDQNQSHSGDYSHNHDTRLEDYLNDKLQTFADFETLDFLLANVQNQQDLLRKQLQDAERDLQDSHKTCAERHAEIQNKAEAFQTRQDDIDARLKIVTQSKTSDDAVRRFESAMGQVRKLDMASGYLDILDEAECIKETASTQLQEEPDKSIEQHARLHYLANTLKSLQEEAEGAAPHLVDHVENTARQVYDTVLASLTVSFEKVLQKLLWPKPDVKIPETVVRELQESAARLLALQRTQLLSLRSSSRRKSNQRPIVLLPFQIMTKPLSTRFNFHFSGQKQTNRLDKPEYFLSHLLDLLDAYSQFVVENLQPVLLQEFRGTDLLFETNYVDALSAFITALLPMLREKIFAVVPQVSKNSQLLSHLMHELMNFDKTLHDDWHYAVGSTEDMMTWNGMSGEVLSQEKWFNRWLEVEKDFALERYQTIIDDPDSSTLDYDSPQSNATKPTKAAIRVNDLLETVTQHYRLLESFNQKLRFLIDIQISIFDSFHVRLSSSLEAFLSMTSSIGRTVQGASASDLAQLKGVSGLDRLCRVFGSADYLERAMRDWSDDVFFVELWNELQSRVRSRTDPVSSTTVASTPSAAGTLSLSEVASRTSDLLHSEDSGPSSDTSVSASGALFDETAAAYARLRARAEGVMTETLISTFREAMRPYSRSDSWTTRTPTSMSDDTDIISSPSEELNAVIDALDSHLGFLHKALGALPLRRISRQISHSLDAYIFDKVIVVKTYSILGARQLRFDVETLAFLIDKYVGGQAGSRGMARVAEASRLLTLPARDGGDKLVGDRMGDQDGWIDADTLGFGQVEDRLFKDNESARQVLQELDCVKMSESEARQVIKRREGKTGRSGFDSEDASEW